jgi:cytochrome b involved in lipid metabolism
MKLHSIKEEQLYSIEEVREHNTETDAWVVIDGKVLDVTSWVPKHPGGSHLIAAFAGNDCSDEFAAFHFPQTYSFLKTYQVGELKGGGSVPHEEREFHKLRRKLWDQGLFNIEAWYFVACILRVLAFALPAFLLISRGGNISLKLVGGVCLGFFEQQSLLMAHDFLHRAVFKKRNASFWGGWFTGSVCGGVGAAWWRRDHFIHHALTNVLGVDPSAGADPFVFIDSKQFLGKKRGAFDYFTLRIQPWLYFPLCLFFARFNLHFISILASPGKLIDAFGISLFWVWKYLLLSQLSNVREMVLVWSVAHLVCSILHLQLNVAHFSTYMWNKEHVHDRGFMYHQIITTMNITCSRFEHWFHGGLEYQIEHHMFPSLPRNQLGNVAPEVKKLLKKTDLPYRTEGFFQANVTCWKMIKNVTDECLQGRNAK